jgi:hypothetical protein
MTEHEKKPEDTKVEEAEEVGLEGLAPDKQNDDAPPPEETRTPFDEA